MLEQASGLETPVGQDHIHMEDDGPLVDGGILITDLLHRAEGDLDRLLVLPGL